MAEHKWVQRGTHCIYKTHWLCLNCGRKHYGLKRPDKDGCRVRRSETDQTDALGAKL